MKDVIVQVDAECGNSSRPYMKYPAVVKMIDIIKTMMVCWR